MIEHGTGYKPSRNALDLRTLDIEYLLKWEEISKLMETWDEQKRGEFTLGLLKIYDRWDSIR